MKNANIFVDVDLTLVDANRNLLTGAAEALTKLRDKGCHLFLWSTNGAATGRCTACNFVGKGEIATKLRALLG
jgi:hydroxymethylpyrimidine pyrophosphatase-like HAD family hydrolase